MLGKSSRLHGPTRRHQLIFQAIWLLHESCLVHGGFVIPLNFMTVQMHHPITIRGFLSVRYDCGEEIDRSGG
jgi:hypothetical protein